MLWLFKPKKDKDNSKQPEVDASFNDALEKQRRHSEEIRRLLMHGLDDEGSSK